jgi:hypothetical protein
MLTRNLLLWSTLTPPPACDKVDYVRLHKPAAASSQTLACGMMYEGELSYSLSVIGWHKECVVASSLDLCADDAAG